MTTRSYGSESTPESIHAMQEGLTVDLIMTPRDRFMTCGTDDSIDSLISAKNDGFSVLPVICNDVVIGLFDVEERFNSNQSLAGKVGDSFERLTEDHLIGSDEHILEFIKSGIEPATKLVVSRGAIKGLVSMADLHKLPVRAALFSVVTGLEIVMANLIKDTWKDNSEGWLGLLSAGRCKKVRQQIREAKLNDTFVSDVAYTELKDKASIVIKSKLLKGGSRTTLEKQFEAIRELRDSLAHASEYAKTLQAAEQVSHTVNAILHFVNQMQSFDASIGN